MTPDLTGREFGLLTVRSYEGTNVQGLDQWYCDCACGKRNVKRVGVYMLHGKTKSCGCLRQTNKIVERAAHSREAWRLLDLITAWLVETKPKQLPRRKGITNGSNS